MNTNQLDNDITMNQLIEYIGREGIFTTDLAAIRNRWETPHEGDVVDFSLVLGAYPFNEPFGTIAGREFCGPDEISICTHPGSIFLAWNNENRTPSVSVSGGPFCRANLNRLQPTMMLKRQTMWNWGNGTPRAGGAVYYHFERPVFRLLPGDKY